MAASIPVWRSWFFKSRIRFMGDKSSSLDSEKLKKHAMKTVTPVQLMKKYGSLHLKACFILLHFEKTQQKKCYKVSSGSSPKLCN